MVIEFRCSNPACGKTVRAPDDAAGRNGQCPKCGTVQTVPAPPPAAAPETGRPAPIRRDGESPGRLTLIRYALRERRGTLIVLGCLAVVFALAYAMFYFLSRREAPSSNIGHSYLQTLLDAKKQAEALQSHTSLNALHAQLMLYSVQHGGRFPRSLDELVQAGLDPRALRVSASSDQTFAYVPGLSGLSGPTKIIVYAPQPDRNGMRLVLRVNGTVETLDEQTFQRQLASQKSQAPPATQPATRPKGR